jgi:hypothetical protein
MKDNQNRHSHATKINKNKKFIDPEDLTKTSLAVSNIPSVNKCRRIPVV